MNYLVHKRVHERNETIGGYEEVHIQLLPPWHWIAACFQWWSCAVCVDLSNRQSRSEAETDGVTWHQGAGCLVDINSCHCRQGLAAGEVSLQAGNLQQQCPHAGTRLIQMTSLLHF